MSIFLFVLGFESYFCGGERVCVGGVNFEGLVYFFFWLICVWLVSDFINIILFLRIGSIKRLLKYNLFKRENFLI